MLRKFLDSKAHLFEKGGKFEKLYPLYEAVDTIFYKPPNQNTGSVHIRDALDLKRVMISVWLAVFPAMFYGMWNLGFHANTYIAEVGIDSINQDWHHQLIALFSNYNADSIWDNFWYGACYFVPIYMVTFIVGGAWEVLFSVVRKHEINEGFFVSSILFALACPPDLPLIYVALGISFGIVVGKEIYGGTGKNFLNPALTGRAFLYFAYPASMSGNEVWVAVDGFSGATILGVAAIEGMGGIQHSWLQAFYGFIPGSIGETSTLLIAVGGIMLLLMRIASFRVVFGCFIGLIATALLLNLIGSNDNPMFAMPWYWHIVVGGFAFGAFFMATDPVSSAMTHTGRWVFGILVGVLTVLIRVVNPAFPEGVMLAILFANICAPLIDYFVEQRNIKRRLNRG